MEINAHNTSLWCETANDTQTWADGTVVSGYYVGYAGRPYTEVIDGGSGGDGIAVPAIASAEADIPLPGIARFVVQNDEYTGTRIRAQAAPLSLPSQLVPGTVYSQYGNKEFLGWSKDTDGTAGVFDFDVEGLAIDEGEMLTLYGQWRQGYWVGFVPNNPARAAG